LLDSTKLLSLWLFDPGLASGN